MINGGYINKISYKNNLFDLKQKIPFRKMTKDNTEGNTEQKAYQRFATRINQQEKSKILLVIRGYYELAEDPSYSNELWGQITDLNLTELKDLCLELCGEAINRDMIHYFLNGSRGNIGPRLYEMLK